jgi:hypothetical protein
MGESCQNNLEIPAISHQLQNVLDFISRHEQYFCAESKQKRLLK